MKKVFERMKKGVGELDWRDPKKMIMYMGGALVVVFVAGLLLKLIMPLLILVLIGYVVVWVFKQKKENKKADGK